MASNTIDFLVLPEEIIRLKLLYNLIQVVSYLKKFDVRKDIINEINISIEGMQRVSNTSKKKFYKLIRRFSEKPIELIVCEHLTLGKNDIVKQLSNKYNIPYQIIYDVANKYNNKCPDNRHIVFRNYIKNLKNIN